MLTNKTVTQATQPKTTQAAQSKTCMKCLGVSAVSRLAELSAARKPFFYRKKSARMQELSSQFANLFITCPEMATRNHKLANKLSSTTCSMTFRSYSRYTPRYTLPKSKCAFFPRAIPSANYSLSIALQENALRVMWLSRETSGTAGDVWERPW